MPARIAISETVSSLERLAEVRLRGGRYAVGTLTEEIGVQIELEDLFLRELALDTKRENPLLELVHEPLDPRAQPRARQDVQRARDLLRDRAAANVVAARTQLIQRAANDAAIIDARVLEEVLVFRRENRLDQAAAGCPRTRPASASSRRTRLAAGRRGCTPAAAAGSRSCAAQRPAGGSARRSNSRRSRHRPAPRRARFRRPELSAKSACKVSSAKLHSTPLPDIGPLCIVRAVRANPSKDGDAKPPVYGHGESRRT